jgi:hypothetical protein
MAQVGPLRECRCRRGLRIHTPVSVLVSFRRQLPGACVSGMRSGKPLQSLHFSPLAVFYSSPQELLYSVGD